MGKRTRRGKGSKPARARGGRRAQGRAQQLGLVRAYKGRGGPRPGAGRPPGKGRRPVAHRPRAQVRGDRPVHLTFRIRDGLPRLRRRSAFAAIRSSIAAGHKEGFSVVHFAVMGNHMHLIAEAEDRVTLARGVQGLKIRIAKRLNRAWRRKGSVFSERYHARPIATPTEARNALLYVLCNARRHARQGGKAMPRRWVDPYSSARQFDGWRQPVRFEPGVVEVPETWLLTTGWRRRGLIDAHAIPGKT